MRQDLENLKKQALRDLAKAQNRDELERVRIKYLGRVGELNKILEKLPSLPLPERRELGRTGNEVKKELEAAAQKKLTELSRVSMPQVDLTLPGISREVGHLHPITYFMRRLVRVFERLGYEVVDGPEVETEEYNFDLLNVPKDHPARDAHDTFWLADTRTEKHKNRETFVTNSYESGAIASDENTKAAGAVYCSRTGFSS